MEEHSSFLRILGRDDVDVNFVYSAIPPIIVLCQDNYHTKQDQSSAHRIPILFLIQNARPGRGCPEA